MPDYDWFSAENIEVACDGLRAEAKKWHGLSDRMAAVGTEAAMQMLTAPAFSVIVDGPVGLATTTDLNDGYQKMFAWLNALFQQGTTEFEAMAEALKYNADWYEEADESSAQNFDAIYASQGQH